jgi:fructokinase
MYRLGIDLGGTKIEGIVLNEENRELFRQRIPTEQEKGYDQILHRILELYKSLLLEIGSADHTLGIGTPGAISRCTGLLKNSNTQCLNERPLLADLQRLLNRQINIENDANCFALAEALAGAGVGKQMVFGVIMGTGCGGGIVYKGEVITGPQAIAGEWGHHSIDVNGPLCWCGSRGCAETLISGGGLENLYENQFQKGLPLVEIIRLYREKHEPAASFVGSFFENFGRALGNLINILDPDLIVLGGGLSNIDELYTDGVRETAKCVFSDGFETPIVKNKLGDSAGVIGAALIGR